MLPSRNGKFISACTKATSLLVWFVSPITTILTFGVKIIHGGREFAVVQHFAVLREYVEPSC
jgi:hypothetical protein